MTKKTLSGGARLISSGKSPVLLGLTPDQKVILRSAADADGRPLTQFLVFHGLVAAKKILRNLPNNPT